MAKLTDGSIKPQIRAANLSGDCKWTRELRRGFYAFSKQHQVRLSIWTSQRHTSNYRKHFLLTGLYKTESGPVGRSQPELRGPSNGRACGERGLGQLFQGHPTF